MLGHQDRLAGDGLERRNDTLVEGDTPLEEDAVADLAPAHDPVQVVLDDRHAEAGHEVVPVRPRLLAVHEVGLHEHGAPLAEPHRRARLERGVAELLDAEAQPLGLLLEKLPVPAAHALFISKSTTRPPLSEILRVPPADLEDRVHQRVGLHLCPGVGRDLVLDDVGPDEIADRMGRCPSCRRPGSPPGRPPPARLRPARGARLDGTAAVIR
jgi:hypothetical protein